MRPKPVHYAQDDCFSWQLDRSYGGYFKHYLKFTANQQMWQ